MTTVEAFSLLLQGKKIHCPCFANYLVRVGGDIKLFNKRSNEECKPTYSFSLLMDQLERTDWAVWETPERQLIKRIMAESSYPAPPLSTLMLDILKYLEKKDAENNRTE
jgi:hypothetical protein